MAQKHTLKKSKSKYGRTRRQRRKQRRMRMHGGEFSLAGLTDGFKGLVSKFSPSTDAEKCTEAKEKAEEVCSNIENLEEPNPSIVNDDVNVSNNELADDARQPANEFADDYAATQPIVTNIATQPIVTNTATQHIVTNDELGNDYDTLANPSLSPPSPPSLSPPSPPSLSPPLSPPPLSPPSLQTPNVSGIGGGRKKSRRKNKNKKQSRRYKKSKSSKKT